MHILKLLITLSYMLSPKGHIWFEGNLFQKHRENQWRYIGNGSYGRFHTIGTKDKEKLLDETHSGHCCKPVTYEEFLCKKALSRMKDRVKTELHVAPSTIYTKELDALVAAGLKDPTKIIDPAVVGLYIREYAYNKCTFLKSRIGLKPQIQPTNFDLNFENENAKYSEISQNEHSLT